MRILPFGGNRSPRAVASVVNIGGHAIDGYQVSNTGEFRAGMEGASVFVGYEKTWLVQTVQKRTKTLEVLQGLGFSACMEELIVEGQEQRRNPKTISLPDLSKVLRYAALNGGKAKAIEVLCGLAEISLYRYFDSTFNGRVGELAEMNKLFENAKIRPALRGDFQRMTSDVGISQAADDHDYRQMG